MEDARRGRQIPTQSVTLPYEETNGQEAIDYYNATGRTAQEWQELLTYDILAVNENGLWVHTKFGFSIPRRNGKNEVVAIRELYGLETGEHILHTAHRTTTSSAASKRLGNLLKSKEAMNMCKGYAYKAQRRLGKGYEVTSMTGKNRVNAEIKANTYEAELDNLRNNTILKAVGNDD